MSRHSDHSHVLVLALLVSVSACHDDNLTSADRSAIGLTPASRTVALNAAGVPNAPGFFWLPPLAAGGRPHSAERSIRVVSLRCALRALVRLARYVPLLRWQTESSPGTARVTVDPRAESYKTTWLAPSTLTLGAGKYQLEIAGRRDHSGARRSARRDHLARSRSGAACKCGCDSR